MAYFHNREEFNQRRKDLRQVLTKPEVILWYYLKGRQFFGYKFRRQHGVGPFVLDFYCPRLRLAIELDGRQHFEPQVQDYDQRRTNYLNQIGIHVVRYPNSAVVSDVQGVLWDLERVIKERGGVVGPPPPSS